MVQRLSTDLSDRGTHHSSIRRHTVSRQLNARSSVRCVCCQQTRRRTSCRPSARTPRGRAVRASFKPSPILDTVSACKDTMAVHIVPYPLAFVPVAGRESAIKSRLF